MNWAARRKIFYLSLVIIFILLTIGIPMFRYFYRAPTCFDGAQNQGEGGIDCGGPCVLLCPNQYAPLNVLWSRFSKVSPGVYNVLAYVENANLDAGIKDLNYIFKLYDRQGTLLKERSGRTAVPTNKIIAIFEPELLTGNAIPQRVEFDFTSEPVWFKEVSLKDNLKISQSLLSRLDSAPRLSATVNNQTVNLIERIEAVGIVYDILGNTVAFSRTIISDLEGKGSQSFDFNWPQPFVGEAVRSEIILRIIK